MYCEYKLPLLVAERLPKTFIRTVYIASKRFTIGSNYPVKQIGAIPAIVILPIIPRFIHLIPKIVVVIHIVGTRSQLFGIAAIV